MWKRFPWDSCGNGPSHFVRPTTEDTVELILNRTWRAALTITGAVGPKANAHGPNEFLHVPYPPFNTHKSYSTLFGSGVNGKSLILIDSRF